MSPHLQDKFAIMTGPSLLEFPLTSRSAFYYPAGHFSRGVTAPLTNQPTFLLIRAALRRASHETTALCRAPGCELLAFLALALLPLIVTSELLGAARGRVRNCIQCKEYWRFGSLTTLVPAQWIGGRHGAWLMGFSLEKGRAHSR